MSVFIVAEAGVNHLGDRAKMLALCDAAKAAGADAVKFQAYDTWALAERRGMLEPHVGPEGREEMVPKLGDTETFNLLEAAQLTDADLDAIAAHCKAIGIKWFASVFDPSQIERVLSRGACALKIGHAESDWAELVRACWAPVESGAYDVKMVWASFTHEQFLSGVAQKSEAAAVLCTPKYPATSTPNLGWVVEPGTYIKDCGIALTDDGRIESTRSWLENACGFSSHYTDYRIPAAAALRGAEYIEAHLMLGTRERIFQDAADPDAWIDKATEPEAAWSLSPDDFAAMVRLIREYETWL